jgi:hypothetical protein
VVSSFHGRIYLEQRDPHSDPSRSDVATLLAEVHLRADTPIAALFAMADHLAALIKQNPDPAVRKQATDILRIGLQANSSAPPAPGSGADASPLAAPMRDG